MTLKYVNPDMLRHIGLVYLATPYSNYEGGLTAAFEKACQLAGGLLKQGVRVYSPIAHTHPIAMHAKIDPKSHDIWIPFDEAMMKASRVLLVADLFGWKESRGVNYEIGYFAGMGKPAYMVACAKALGGL